MSVKSQEEINLEKAIEEGVKRVLSQLTLSLDSEQDNEQNILTVTVSFGDNVICKEKAYLSFPRY